MIMYFKALLYVLEIFTFMYHAFVIPGCIVKSVEHLIYNFWVLSPKTVYICVKKKTTGQNGITSVKAPSQ